jgi:aspartyl-tRNA(Asn)/glutamyl-tRNA(Gln) amidotransferase subunit B
MQREPVIGLEIHAQLLTASKIFCACSTEYGAPPNTHVCPVCLGLPGALPVLNRQAVDLALRVGVALNCTVHGRSVFARKNYFYPDLPKGYQITQYDRPLATDGFVEYLQGDETRRVGITRVHLEEDAGKSLHDAVGDSDRQTRVDFNRSGVALVEIVTEPDLRSAADAGTFFARLRAILVEIGVNDGNMEEGSLRCDANVSVRAAGAPSFGVKTEIKNLNSFGYLEKALEFEIARHTALLDRGQTIIHETRLWDQAAKRTVPMRSKEEAEDYRYFPEPDLPVLSVPAEALAAAKSAIPELPEARTARLMEQYHLSRYHAELVASSMAVSRYFERTAAIVEPKSAANWITREVFRAMHDHHVDIDAVPVTPTMLAELIQLVERGEISGASARTAFDLMYESRRSAREIARERGLAQIADRDELERVVKQTLGANGKAVDEYRSGKTKAFGFLVGQVIKQTGGRANPALVNELVKKALE